LKQLKSQKELNFLNAPILADRITEIAVFIEGSSNRRGVVLMDQQGFKYSRDSVSKRSQGWKCCKYRALRCKARVSTIEDVIIKRSEIGHNHDPTVKSDIEIDIDLVTQDPFISLE
jgi:hypothetical protein